MRVLVCGGRDFNDENVLYDALDEFHEQHNIGCIIHGGARGADALSSKWAAARNIETFSYPADWDQYGHSAGPIRNAQMLKEGRPMAVIAFPGGRGTADMVGQARAAGIDIYIIRVRRSPDLAPSDWEVEV